MQLAKGFHVSFRRRFPKVKISRLPTDEEIRLKMTGYISRKHSEGIHPTMEEVRKCFSPTPGRTLTRLRKIVVELGLQINDKDRVVAVK